MSSPTASAQVIPTNESTVAGRLKDETGLRRIPTIDEVPLPAREFTRGEVVVYQGVSFGERRRAYPSSGTSSAAKPIENMQLFTDEARPGQIFARVLILDEGGVTPREALITPMIAAAAQDKAALDRDYSLHGLVESANVEISRFFDDFGPIDSELKMKEFRDYVEDKESLSFLFSNLMNKNRGQSMDLFAAYFAPGGAMSGVGVFVNTWL